MTCPLNKKTCQGCPYSKGLCDYPYRIGMTLEQIKAITRGSKLPERGLRGLELEYRGAKEKI